jgi:hypothetical protein
MERHTVAVPMRTTLFLRRLLPRQLVRRFAWINLTVLQAIRLSRPLRARGVLPQTRRDWRRK